MIVVEGLLLIFILNDIIFISFIVQMEASKLPYDTQYIQSTKYHSFNHIVNFSIPKDLHNMEFLFV